MPLSPSRRAVLVDSHELRAALASDAPPAVLDVRWSLGGPDGAEEYAAGHVPTARYIDLETELAAPPGPGTGRHPLPATGDLEKSLRRAGVRDGQAVVVYDSAAGTSAGRAWWLLRWAGIADVRLLDGGYPAWVASGGEVSTNVPPVGEGDVRLTPGRLPTLSPHGAAELASSPGVLLDARAPERYRGESEPVDPVAGHIPGAVSAPTTGNVDADGRLLSDEALRERFAALGVEPGTAVGVYCGSGVTAAHQVLALAAIGIDAALYPGSWSQWVADPGRPVATGADPG